MSRTSGKWSIYSCPPLWTSKVPEWSPMKISLTNITRWTNLYSKSGLMLLENQCVDMIVTNAETTMRRWIIALKCYLNFAHLRDEGRESKKWCEQVSCNLKVSKVLLHFQRQLRSSKRTIQTRRRLSKIPLEERWTMSTRPRQRRQAELEPRWIKQSKLEQSEPRRME